MVLRLVADLYLKTETHRLSTTMKVKKNPRGPVRPRVPAQKRKTQWSVEAWVSRDSGVLHES
jgi:hypothetical protein